MIFSRLFFRNMIIRGVGIISLTAMFALCQSDDTKNQAAGSESKTISKSEQQEGTSGQKKTASKNNKLIVYYFHGNFRCHSCTMIEKLTCQAVNTGFAKELEKGRVELKIVNVEDAGNEHFSDDYKLYTKSVILSDVKDGKEGSWKNLEKVWTLLKDEKKFIDYIQAEVKALL